jgi:NAD(P)H dehydrogenase (quinone)
MTIVGLDYGYAGQMGVDEVRAERLVAQRRLPDGNGSRQPSEADLGGARYLGERVARTAAN